MALLLDVLAVKQRLLGDLEQIERALDPFRNQQPSERPWPTPDDRRRCAAELDECERLLKEIVVQERQSESELSRRRDRTAERLQGTQIKTRGLGLRKRLLCTFLMKYLSISSV